MGWCIWQNESGSCHLDFAAIRCCVVLLAPFLIWDTIHAVQPGLVFLVQLCLMCTTLQQLQIPAGAEGVAVSSVPRIQKPGMHKHPLDKGLYFSNCCRTHFLTDKKASKFTCHHSAQADMSLMQAGPPVGRWEPLFD